MDFIRLIEGSSLMVWLREGGSLWGYPAILFMHTLGLGTVAGVSGAIGLRVLGFGRRIPLPTLLPVFSLVWAALTLTALSGLVLLFADATARLSSPVFYVKMAFVIVAVVCMQQLKRQATAPDRAVTAPPGRLWAIASIGCWVAAITAGRLMAYLGPVG